MHEISDKVEKERRVKLTAMDEKIEIFNIKIENEIEKKLITD
jgi:hypothetical protein